MEPWQAAMIGRIVGEIDRFATGGISRSKLVENSRGLFEAADISDNETSMAFESAWVAVDAQADPSDRAVEKAGMDIRAGPERCLVRYATLGD